MPPLLMSNAIQVSFCTMLVSMKNSLTTKGIHIKVEFAIQTNPTKPLPRLVVKIVCSGNAVPKYRIRVIPKSVMQDTWHDKKVRTMAALHG